MLSPISQLGLTLLELMIALAIAAFLMAMAVPSFSDWIAAARIRTSAEALLAGAQLARAEAVKRNALVRFQLTSTADASCALSASGNNWVISLDDPSAACGATPSSTAAPRIIQARSGNEGTSNVTVAGLAGTSAASLVRFNGLGQLVAPANGFSVQVSLPASGSCRAAGGDLRCLQVRVSASGQVKMCDPALSVSDPEGC
ncbi:MAG: prepilin-type N-terminal cleavage/methylation protein [Hydrocarboniphaga sp.]|uniref:GspH/FimT family pseudopilin n=1 Tax=Hydrocarboniphaga sp. TaxID=2033016 RepID=UPI00260A106D|nr:GspH/FimT family pseudopilin [Hydrocarboniphaga sp.]MDB5971606.1 prepilin-type N-terminal cleavage/methylation protein [Hydrocarboniphaga sp.]